MKPEKQRIAIAEACPSIFQMIGRHFHWRNAWEGDDTQVDPLSDLNAMHEAEKVLTEEQYYNYCTRLSELARKTRTTVNDYHRSMVSSTAAQRAEAFLRCIGKWEEEQQ